MRSFFISLVNFPFANEETFVFQDVWLFHSFLLYFVLCFNDFALHQQCMAQQASFQSSYLVFLLKSTNDT